MPLPSNSFLQPVPEVPYETQALRYTILPNTISHRARRKTEQASRIIEVRPLDSDEIQFIIEQANKKKINLSAIGLGDLDSIKIATYEQGLFTFVTLQRSEYREESFYWYTKTGVTKRTANEEHDPVQAKNIALWRAVLAPSIF